MGIILVVCGIGLFGLMIPILNWLIPNFQREDKAARQAVHLSRSETEWRRIKKGRAVLYISENLLPKMQRRSNFNLDKLLGPKMRQMVDTIGKYDSLEEMIAAKLVFAAVATLPIILIIIAAESLYFIIPIFFVVFFIKGIRDTRIHFLKIQREITKDLPKLIEKMMMALETGKSFVIVFRELELSSGPRMKKMLKRLNANLQDMDHASAIEIFARETTIPVMMQFSQAVKIGLNSGFEEAKDHFEDIRAEILQLRKTALIEMTRSRPDRVKLLQFAIITCALGSVVICFVNIFSSMGKIF